MKKILLTLSFLFSVCMVLSAQKHDVRLNLQPGLKVPVRHQQVMDQEISFQGQTMKNKVIQKNDLVFSVISKNQDNLIIEAMFNLLEVSAESPQGNMKISSADEKETMENKMLKQMAGKVVRAEITPYFQLVGEVTPVTEGLSKEEAAQIYQAFSSVFVGLYPTSSVAQGETWTIEMGGGLKGESTLTSASPQSFIIDSKVSMDTDMQGVKISGKGSMNYEIHAPTGVPVYGLMTMPASGSSVANGVPVNIKMNVTSSFEFVQ